MGCPPGTHVLALCGDLTAATRLNVPIVTRFIWNNNNSKPQNQRDCYRRHYIQSWTMQTSSKLLHQSNSCVILLPLSSWIGITSHILVISSSCFSLFYLYSKKNMGVFHSIEALYVDLPYPRWKQQKELLAIWISQHTLVEVFMSREKKEDKKEKKSKWKRKG